MADKVSEVRVGPSKSEYSANERLRLNTGEAIRKMLDKLNTELCNAGCVVECETREERQRLIDAVKDKYAQAIAATVVAWTCKDCKYAHMTSDGKHCKWCSIMATHAIDSAEYHDQPNGYDPEPYFDADFFCGNFEKRIEVSE